MTDSPPPAWYADPMGRWDYRYWDGAGWTDHVSRSGVTGTDPVTQEMPGESQAALDASDEQPSAKTGALARFSATRNQKKADRDSFDALAVAASHGDETALAQLPAAVAHARSLWHGGIFEHKLVDVLVAAIRDVMSDDVLTKDEEDRIARTAEALGTQVQSLQTSAPEVFEELAVGQINSGRLPTIPDADLMLKPGEVAHGSFGVELMKEVVLREFRGGSSGVSIPLGMGVRYRTGSVRGRSVVVGSQLVAQDAGLLTVTSSRSVFTGQKKTLEFRRDRLVGMQQYADGVRLNVSNRQTASLFKMQPGQSATILAALITAT